LWRPQLAVKYITPTVSLLQQLVVTLYHWLMTVVDAQTLRNYFVPTVTVTSIFVTSSGIPWHFTKFRGLRQILRAAHKMVGANSLILGLIMSDACSFSAGNTELPLTKHCQAMSTIWLSRVLLPAPTKLRRQTISPASVSLFVCAQNISKSHWQILIKLHGRVQLRPRKERLNFGTDHSDVKFREIFCPEIFHEILHEIFHEILFLWNISKISRCF